MYFIHIYKDILQRWAQNAINYVNDTFPENCYAMDYENAQLLNLP